MTVHITRDSKNSYSKNFLIDNINNPRKLWKIFKNLVPSKNISSPSALVIDDIKIIDPKEIANQFNSYFASVSANLIPTRSTNFNYEDIEIDTDELKFSIPLMTLDQMRYIIFSITWI